MTTLENLSSTTSRATVLFARFSSADVGALRPLADPLLTLATWVKCGLLGPFLRPIGQIPLPPGKP